MAAEFVGRLFHFKKSLKEFSWLNPTDLVALKVSNSYPKLQFIYENKTASRHHAVKLNSEQDEFIFKQVGDHTVNFSIESLRLAFTRLKDD